MVTDKEREGHDLPVRTAVALLIVLFVLACLPIWLVKYPPLVDYPLHAARAYLLSLPQDGTGITEFYQAKWSLIPNLGMDILVSQLMRVMPPLIASKVFLCLILGGLLSGSFAFSVAIWKRITFSAFLPFIALYDLWFYMGFANYLLGIGLGLWTAATWLWTTDWPKARRVALLAVLGVLLIVCHLMAFLVTSAICLALYAIDKGLDKRKLIWATILACGLCYVGLTLIHRKPISWSAKEMTILDSPGPIMFFLPLFAMVLGKKWRTGEWTAHPKSLALVACLGALVLVGPTYLGGTAFACERLTVPLCLIFLGSLDWHALGTSMSSRVFWIALCVAAGTPSFLRVERSAKFPNEVVQALQEVEPRATLASFDLGLTKQVTWRYQRHIPDWLLLDKPVFVAQNFAKTRQQPMVFRPEFEEWHKFQDNNPVELKSWDELFDRLGEAQGLQGRLNDAYVKSGRKAAPLYALVFHPPDQNLKRADPRLEVVASGPEFTLVRVLSPNR